MNKDIIEILKIHTESIKSIGSSVDANIRSLETLSRLLKEEHEYTRRLEKRIAELERKQHDPV